MLSSLRAPPTPHFCFSVLASDFNAVPPGESLDDGDCLATAPLGFPVQAHDTVAGCGGPVPAADTVGHRSLALRAADAPYRWSRPGGCCCFCVCSWQSDPCISRESGSILGRRPNGNRNARRQAACQRTTATETAGAGTAEPARLPGGCGEQPRCGAGAAATGDPGAAPAAGTAQAAPGRASRQARMRERGLLPVKNRRTIEVMYLPSRMGHR